MGRLEPVSSRVSRTARRASLPSAPPPTEGTALSRRSPMPPASPLLTSRRHIDLLRVCSAISRRG
ncbi:putative leader peptide [Streptomyces sp. NPDC088789]|uniref:putative leader peptide n=1 Tax=Streptomyces sp. NPDC088789 TaxID=3365899 RepID=UPI003820DA46